MQFASFSLMFKQLLDKLEHIVKWALSFVYLKLVLFDQSEVDQVIDQAQ